MLQTFSISFYAPLLPSLLHAGNQLIVLFSNCSAMGNTPRIKLFTAGAIEQQYDTINYTIGALPFIYLPL